MRVICYTWIQVESALVKVGTAKRCRLGEQPGARGSPISKVDYRILPSTHTSRSDSIGHGHEQTREVRVSNHFSNTR